MKLLATTLALTALAGPLWAQAYVSVKGGATQVQDVDFGMLYDGVTTAPASAKFDTGYTGNIAVGAYVNDHVRVEFEGGYSKSDVKQATFNNAPLAADGNVTTYTGMVNGYYDFAPSSILRPYVGVGAGAAKVSYKKVRLDGSDFVDSSDTVAAGQAMAGLKWQATPLTAATMEYRYIQTGSVDLTDAGGGTRSVDHSSHNFMVGLEHKFY